MGIYALKSSRQAELFFLYKSVFHSSFETNFICVGLNGTVACPNKFALVNNMNSYIVK